MTDLAEKPLAPAPPIEHAIPAAAHAESGTENRKMAMWLFLASECMFFAVLIASYIYASFKFPDQHAILNIPLTSLNTFLLLTSSFTVVRALAAIESGDRKKFVRSLALTGLLGSLFLFIQANEFSNLSREGLTLSSSLFGMAFFTLTGFHGAHVLVGVIWLVTVFLKAFNGGFSKNDHFGVEFFGLYWHFVDVVWIFIFSVVYLIAPK
ncbi:MAG TPA: cytochrome c oxidase subunit 3 [Aggregatilineales bacterium]|nr:cytochrome c oxidase subunit 3 [Aggregatilineales bacterium]